MYYAKYLPVPGEVKDGGLTYDTVNPDDHIELFKARFNGDILYDNRGFVRQIKHCKPVELSLCDDMLREGDKIQSVDGSGTAVITEFTKVGANAILTYPDGRTAAGSFLHHQLENDWCKVIGRVSPDAVWVLPGDQFEEDEVKIVTDTRITNIEDIDDWTHAEKETYVKWCEIKGPCTHFH